jgi:hypothetical protein
MSSSFDPYQQWLGIPPQEQPPDHYRLLGIARFERDAAVIQAAAEQRMAHIRTFQTGPRSGYTQPLLNELAAAKLRLLSPASKSQYDAALADAVSLSEQAFSTELLPPSEEAGEVSGAAGKTPVEIKAQFSPAAREGDSSLPGWWLPLAGMLLALSLGAAWVIVQRVRPRGGGTKTTPEVVVEKSKVKTPATPARAIVQQDAGGDIRLPCDAAEIRGGLQVRSSAAGDAIAGWSSEEDVAEWQFHVAKLPSQGVFRVLVTYRCDPAGGECRYLLKAGDQSRKREVRAAAGQLVDEFYLAVPRTGEHPLSIRYAGRGAGFEIVSVELQFPRARRP